MRDNSYVTTFNLASGEENKNNNISDLSFLNNQLFVLQKNRSSILKIWVYGNKNGPILERLDYSKYAYIFDSNQHDANGNMIDKDFAEGLVVHDKVASCFMTRENQVPSVKKDRVWV
ncbi:MAG: hypothetical protein R2877_01050 [Bdellovibrionota bacterium]